MCKKKKTLLQLHFSKVETPSGLRTSSPAVESLASMVKLRTNADSGWRARQLVSQLSSLTQVEVAISRLVTSTKRTALRVSAQLRTQQSGHRGLGRRRCSGNVGRERWPSPIG